MPIQHFRKFISGSKKRIQKIKEKINEISKIEQYEEDHIKKEYAEPKSKQPEKITVNLSIASVAKATLVIMLLYFASKFIYEIKSILLILFVAILFYAAIEPTVNKLENRRIPRAISVLGIYLMMIGVIVFFISNLIPIVAEQLLEIARSAGQLITNITEGKALTNLPFSDKLTPLIHDALAGIDQATVINNIQAALEKIAGQLQNVAGNTWTAIKIVFNGIFNAILVLIITFFLVTDKGSVDGFIKSLFPIKYTDYIIEKSEKIKGKIGQWLRGQLMLMGCMFILYLTGFWILGIDYAITLAMMGGLAELLPVIGPILAGIPAILIGFNESPWLVLWVLGLIILIQQIEGNILIPVIMKKAVGLKPVVIMISVLIGYQLLGILGIVLAVPVATTASIFINDYLRKDK
ncbi:MAG: AI-2E family transporter [Candidatus Gracilibacteria bacterium]